MPSIVVLGGGPAGAVVAAGLARLGEQVQVIAAPRRFAAVEGASPRVLQALHGAGFAGALAAFRPPSPRHVFWNGLASSANHEYLVERQVLDEALLQDLRAMGVSVHPGRLDGVAPEADGYRLALKIADERRYLHADFVVEARGRAAPAQGYFGSAEAGERLRGAETVSILQYWYGPAGEAASGAQSCAEGWAWMAALGDGRRYLQLTLDGARAALPAKQDLAAFCADRLGRLELAQAYLADAQPRGAPYARTSTPICNRRLAGRNWIRVGDAAMAVDPLSGNGMFQALSSALQAPAVIATLLHDPEQAMLATRFHQQRVEALFYRFARIGRDFYAQEKTWVDQPFWASRRHWPDDLPAHPAVTPANVGIEIRPVVLEGRIAAREVVVTPDQPNGIWHAGGVLLVPVLRAVQCGGGRAEIQARVGEVLRQQGQQAERAGQVLGWMVAQGWIEAHHAQPDSA